MGKLLDKAIKWEMMNASYPETQMNGIIVAAERGEWYDADYVHEKIDNIIRFYSDTLLNFERRLSDKELRKEFYRFVKSGKR